MKKSIRKFGIVILVLSIISCTKIYKPLTLGEFKEAMKEKKIEKIIFDYASESVLVSFKTSEDLLEIERESVYAKDWIDFVRKEVENYDTTGITFVKRSGLY